MFLRRMSEVSEIKLPRSTVSSATLSLVESVASLNVRPMKGSTNPLEIAVFKYPQSALIPPTPIRTWSSVGDIPVETYPTWLYPHVDWEMESRWGHCSLKVFALIARLVATAYWLATDLPGIKHWPVLCLFYHACPGLLGVESSAILPYLLSPIPFRTLSWVHDILGIVFGFASVSAIYFTSDAKVLLTLLTLTVIPLSVDLALHVATVPRYAMTV